MKVVIVGGVAGGASAAARLRRLDESAHIIVFERSGYVSYANCGLPYYIGGVIENRDLLTLQTPKSFKSRFNIDVRVHHEVVAIHRERKTVTVRNLETGAEFEETYDKLILSPGARPIRPPMPGLESKRLFTLRTVEDTLQIRNCVEKEKPRRAVLAGGGFIGLELAENLYEMGIEVTIVQMLDQLLTPLDKDMASFVHARFRAKGVHLMLKTAVSGFEEREGCILTHVDGGEPLCSEMAILAIGVSPDSSLAREAGLELSARGAIAVDEHMRTSDPDIYAVGDAVQVRNAVTGSLGLVSLAGPANKQGRIAADHLCGLDSAYHGAYASSVIKVFDMTAAATGINEHAAKEAGLSYEKIVLSPENHASYYPGGRAMTIKLLYEKESLRILGAQIVGFDGVDKRIDVLATAMQAGMKAPELACLDLAYAPPYSSAKDPVNMAGFIAENIETGKVKQFHYEDLADLRSRPGVTLLDTRTVGEYAAGHAEGFINIPLDSLRDRLAELDAHQPVYVMCQSGLRSYLACRILSQHGYECYNFSGGYRLYRAIVENAFNEQANTPCGFSIGATKD